MQSATRKLGFAVLLLFALISACCAQDASVPGAAFLSLDKYTNAFFGFSLPLPPDPAFRIAEVSKSGLWLGYRLFGLAGRGTTFVISAQWMTPEDAERIMSGAPRILINGKQFSRGLSHRKQPQGTIWQAMYWTVADNYLLTFHIQSLDRGLAEEFEHCVEQTRFFDPAKAKQIAGPSARPYSPSTPPPLNK